MDSAVGDSGRSGPPFFATSAWILPSVVPRWFPGPVGWRWRSRFPGWFRLSYGWFRLRLVALPMMVPTPHALVPGGGHETFRPPLATSMSDFRPVPGDECGDEGGRVSEGMAPVPLVAGPKHGAGVHVRAGGDDPEVAEPCVAEEAQLAARVPGSGLGPEDRARAPRQAAKLLLGRLRKLVQHVAHDQQADGLR